MKSVTIFDNKNIMLLKVYCRKIKGKNCYEMLIADSISNPDNIVKIVTKKNTIIKMGMGRK